MTRILLIETATRVCSVGVASEHQIIGLREEKSMQYSHSSHLTGFVQDCVQEAGITFQQLDAVAVSKGPGSYTGLRIGVSAAKGLCYALDIPLISVNTLHSMAEVAVKSLKEEDEKPDFLVPMIDARRMEVYNAVFDRSAGMIRETMAEIIDENAFEKYLQKGRVLFFGDGAPKCREVIKHLNASIVDTIYPGVEGLQREAIEKFGKQQFEDTAYFEPFYLKDFVAGKPRVKGLH